MAKSGLSLKTWSLDHSKIHQYHTQAFDKKPKFSTQDLDLPKLFRFSKSYNYSVGTRTFGRSYSWQSECIYCSVSIPYDLNDHGACKACGDEHKMECDSCLEKTSLNDLKWYDKDCCYLCGKCRSEDKNTLLFECCCCGDWLEEKDLMIVSSKDYLCYACTEYYSKTDHYLFR